MNRIFLFILLVILSNSGFSQNNAVYSGGADVLKFKTGGTDRIIIDANGKMGIGTMTPNAEAYLDITGTAGGILVPRLTSAERSALTGVEGLICYDTDLNCFCYYDGTWIKVANSAGGFSDADGDTKVQVEESADEDFIRFDTQGGERMVIDNAGNVGIGETSPDYALDISGTTSANSSVELSRFSTAALGSSDIFINRSNNATQGTHTLMADGQLLGRTIFSGSDGTSFQRAAAIGASVDGTPGASDMPGRLQFYTVPDGTTTLTERMRITNSGFVGINQTNPSELLHVSEGQYLHDVNTAGSASQAVAKSLNLVISSGTQSAMAIGRADALYLSGSAVSTGSLAAGSQVTAGSNYIEASTSGTVNEMIGVENIAVAKGAHGNITTAYGSFNILSEEGSGIVSSGVGAYTAISNSGTGSITSAYGNMISVENTGGGSITNAFGLYIADVNTATNNTAIYTNSGNILLNDAQDASTSMVFRGPTVTDLFYVDGPNDRIGIGTSSPASILDITGTDAVIVPGGTTAQRPGTQESGMFRFNSTTGLFEGYTASSWQSFTTDVTMADTDGDTKIQVEESADEDYIRFDTQGSERMVIDNTGNVGIGTASPLFNLEIENDSPRLLLDNTNSANFSSFDTGESGTVTGNFAQFGSTSATLPNDVIINNVTTGGGAGGISLSVANLVSTPALRITPVGLAGLGTNNPASELHIYRSASSPALTIQGVTAGGNYSSLLLESDEATDKYWRLLHKSSPANEFRIDYSPDDGPTVYNVVKIAPQTASDALVIDGSANVGLGTIAPSTKLHAIEDNATTSTILDVLTLERSTTGTSAIGIGLGLSFQLEDAGDVQKHGAIELSLNAVTEGVEESSMGFKINKAGTLTELLTLDGTFGYVGVNQPIPAAMLSVQGIGNTSAATGLLVTDNLGNALFGVRDDGFVGVNAPVPLSPTMLDVKGKTSSAGNYTFLARNSSDFLSLVVEDDGTTGFGDGTPDAVVEIAENGTDPFMISNGAAGDGDFMIVKTDGKVGIGTTTPSELLHVTGKIVMADGTEGDGKFMMSNANGVASWENAYRTVAKPADENVSFNASLQDDDDLFFNVNPNEVYQFRILLYFSSSASPDFKLGFSSPAGATMLWNTSDKMTFDALDESGVIVITFAGSTIKFTVIEGMIETAGTGGVLQMRWAQQVSNAAPTIVKKGSTISFMKVL